MLEDLLNLIEIMNDSQISNEYVLAACEPEDDTSDLYFVLPPKMKNRLLLLYKKYLPDNYQLAQQIMQSKHGPNILITAILQKSKVNLSDYIINNYGSFEGFMQRREPTLTAYENHTKTEQNENMYSILEEEKIPPIATEYFEEAIAYATEISSGQEVAIASIQALAATDYYKASCLLAKLLDSLEENEKGDQSIC